MSTVSLSILGQQLTYFSVCIHTVGWLLSSVEAWPICISLIHWIWSATENLHCLMVKWGESEKHLMVILTLWLIQVSWPKVFFRLHISISCGIIELACLMRVALMVVRPFVFLGGLHFFYETTLSPPHPFFFFLQSNQRTRWDSWAHTVTPLLDTH